MVAGMKIEDDFVLRTVRRIKEFTDWVQGHPWLSSAALLGALFVVAAVFDTSSPTTADTSAPAASAAARTAPAPQAPDSKFHGRQREIESAFTDALGADAPEARDRVDGIARIAKNNYLVEYNPDEVVFGEDEVLRDLRPVFDSLLNDLDLRAAEIVPYVDLVTAGGKDKVGPLLRIRCDRSDNAAIDWAAIDEDGMKQLCDYTLLVSK